MSLLGYGRNSICVCVLCRCLTPSLLESMLGTHVDVDTCTCTHLRLFACAFAGCVCSCAIFVFVPWQCVFLTRLFFVALDLFNMAQTWAWATQQFVEAACERVINKCKGEGIHTNRRVIALEKTHETMVESLQSRVALLEKAHERTLESLQSRVGVMEMRLEEANISNCQRSTMLEEAAMDAAVPAPTSQGASSSSSASEVPTGPSPLPAAAPPPTSQGASSSSGPVPSAAPLPPQGRPEPPPLPPMQGMVMVGWMHHPRPSPVPVPLKVYSHYHPERFMERFFPEGPGGERFTGAKDIDWADEN